ncbi:MAG: hypothetical protein IKD79_01750 [Oscillospiraceae bacterium]|nr:hypothetical protein [Oscillospiraceae bacterium]
MLTVDYAFYTDVYRGTLPEAAFDRLSLSASACLGEFTQGGVPDDPDRLGPEAALRVRLAFCAVLEARAEQEERAGIAAETNDGISVTYVTGEAQRSRELYAAAAAFLGPTGLLYRGVELQC